MARQETAALYFWTKKFGELMKTEAGHIETLGNEFEKLDQDISDMVKKYFG